MSIENENKKLWLIKHEEVRTSAGSDLFVATRRSSFINIRPVVLRRRLSTGLLNDIKLLLPLIFQILYKCYHLVSRPGQVFFYKNLILFSTEIVHIRFYSA